MRTLRTWSDVQSAAYILLAVLAVGVALFFGIDAVASTRGEADQATVINREYHAAYTSSRTVTDENGHARVHTTHHPARYVVSVSHANGVSDYEVSSSSWPLFVIGAQCSRWERRGRFTGWLWGHSITPITVDLRKTE